MERYEANRAVIIGGTSGIGLATVKLLLDGGVRVVGRNSRRQSTVHFPREWRFCNE